MYGVATKNGAPSRSTANGTQTKHLLFETDEEDLREDESAVGRASPEGAYDRTAIDSDRWVTKRIAFAVIAPLAGAVIMAAILSTRGEAPAAAAMGSLGCACACAGEDEEPAEHGSNPIIEGMANTNAPSEEVVYDGPCRAFTPWNGTDPFPCYESDGGLHDSARRHKQRGFFYVKVPKTASSTLSGIALRIASRKSHNILNGRSMCNVEEAHGFASDHWHYERRDKARSFLWSFVREPTKRAVSFFFYNHVSRRREDPTDENFINWARTKTSHTKDYQMNYLKLHEKDTAVEAVEDILNEYNFIGVTERLDESLVVLQMLLGLDVWDMLYMSSKLSGGFGYVHNGKNPHCLYEIPKFVSPGMKEYFASREWQSLIEGDLILHRAANASLDRTIDALGRDAFGANLRRFQEANSLAHDRCASEVIYPCTPGGKLLTETNCYWEDKGCGYPCLDRVSSELAV